MWKRHLGVALLVGGVVNAAPAVGALSAVRLRTAYGLDGRVAPDHDLDLLLQHRGILFLVTGGLLVVAVARPHLRATAVTANATSCAAFVVLTATGGPVNVQLTRIMWIDLGVLALLAGGALLTRGVSSRTGGER
jgi:hypothetical protein